MKHLRVHCMTHSGIKTSLLVTNVHSETNMMQWFHHPVLHSLLIYCKLCFVLKVATEACAG